MYPSINPAASSSNHNETVIGDRECSNPSKAVCMMCLCSGFTKTDLDDTLLEFYEELVYFDMYQHANLNVCPLCEHQLRKFYNFRQKCRRSLILLKNWSNYQDKALHNLYAMTPRSSIGVCTKAALQKLYIFGWTEPNDGAESGDQNNSQKLTECLLVVKPIQSNQHITETDKNKNGLVHDLKLPKTNIKSFLEGFTGNNEQEIIEIESDHNTEPYNIPDHRYTRKKRKRPISTKKLEKIALKEELSVLEANDPDEFKKRMKDIREAQHHKRQVKYATQLKDMLITRLEEGEFDDIEDLGVRITKDVFLKMFEKCSLNSMAVQGLFKSNIDTLKLRRFLKSLLRRFNPEYETIFDVECLDTQEKKLAEFKSRQYSKEYLEAHHRCDICYKVFEVQGILDYHKKWHGQEQKRPNVCSICLIQYRGSTASHNWFNHSFVFRCKLCPFCTHSPDNMKSHYQMHKGAVHSCPICKKEFICRSTMENHRRREHRSCFQCAFCARTLVSVTGLKQHLKLKHNDETPEMLSATPTVQCSDCEAAFHNEQALCKHTERHHNSARPITSPVHKCFFCKETFPTVSELQAHKTQMEHRGRRQKSASSRQDVAPFLTCPVCGQEVVNDKKRSLFIHHRKQHPGIKYKSLNETCNYLCEQCGRAFTCNGTYQEHLNSHSGVKPYECSECGARFASRMRASVHVGRHGPPRYPCNICNKRFPTATALYLHKRIHIGDRRFKCEICPKDFLHAASLRYHVDGVHNRIRKVRTGIPKPRLKKILSADLGGLILMTPPPAQTKMKDEDFSFTEDLDHMDVVNEVVVGTDNEI